jgi:hypothetical protein
MGEGVTVEAREQQNTSEEIDDLIQPISNDLNL